MSLRTMTLPDGGTLVFDEVGEGRPVVLVHGFTLDHRMWDDQLPALDEYRVIRPDMRGFGQSSWPEGNAYTHRADLLALLDHCGIGQAHLVGLSMGGAISLDFAVGHPERVRSLTLIDADVPGFPPPPPPPPGTPPPVPAAPPEGVDPVAWFMEGWLKGPLIAPSLGRRGGDRLEAIIRDYRGSHLQRQGRMEFPVPAAYDVLESIHIPTLVMIGEDDVSLFPRADALATRIPGARKVVIGGAAHMANMDQPELVNAALVEFLEVLDREDAIG